MTNPIINFAKKILPSSILDDLYIYIVTSYGYKKIIQLYLNITVPEIVTTKYGFKIKSVPGDTTMRKSFMNGVWEPHVSYLIENTVEEGFICLDIGANVGFDTMVFSKFIGHTGKVYAFEPSHKIFSILKENILLNQMNDNVIILNQGVGSKSDTKKLFIDNFSFGGSSICHNYGGESEEIKITTIDEMQLDRVDFIKMDIEGYEYEALLGMQNTLQKNKEIKLVFEWSPQYYNNLSEDGKKYSINILNFLVSKGFSLYELDPINVGEKVRITNFELLYDKVGSKFGSHTDILAMRQ